MAIIDNRTALSGFETGDTPAQPDDLSGAAGGTADTEIFIEGSRSWGYYTTTTRAGLMYDAGSAQNWAGNTFYIWVNCGIAGLLDTFANGGMAVRFAGNTVGNWFEVNVAGSDIYPAAVSGGWVMLVVDIDKAKTASHRTGGTPPATSAIRYVGVTTITGGTMPRMADNTWVDKMWRLPAATPGILVEGVNVTPDWTWADIVSTAEAGSWGTAKTTTGGAIAINTPIRFGANDAVTHGFSDTLKTILWEDWDVATGFYGLTVIGGSGAQSFEMGVVTGSGDDQTGSQGCLIEASASGERWFFDCDDANVDVCNLYGCTFKHGGDLQFDSATVSTISTALVDCSSVAIDNSTFLKNSIIAANTADGVAFVTVADLADVVRCSFNFSDGHAIELTGGTSSQTSKGNLFNSYGITTSNDAALYNNTGALRTITITDGGDSPTYRDGSGASTVVVAGAVTVEVTSITPEGTPIGSAGVLLMASSGAGQFPFEDSVTITRSGSTATVSHTLHLMSSGDKVLIVGVEATEPEYIGVKEITVTGPNSYTYTVSGTPTTPATGAITSTFVALEGVTDASTGVLSTTRVYAVDQPVVGWTRKMSSAPFYKEGVLTGTISTTDGYIVSAVMPLDE